MRWHHFLFLSVCLSLSGCYYIHDIQNQTVGSFVGGMVTGIATVETSLMGTAGGMIAASMFGTVLGEFIDNYPPYALLNEDPLITPVDRYYYEIIRPPLDIQRPFFHTQRFTTGKIYYHYSDRLPLLHHQPPTVNTLDSGVSLCLPRV